MNLTTPLQRSLYGSLFQRQSGRFSLIAALVALFLYALPVFKRYYLTHPAAMIVGLLAAFVIYLPTLLVLYFIDRRNRKPSLLFWGAILSVIFYFGPITSRTSRLVQEVTTLSQWQFAGFVEEFWKVAPLLLLVIFVRPAVNGVRDGLIYGALGGLGFAILESSAYFALMSFADEGWNGIWENLLGRATLLGTDIHVLFSATVGAAIGYGVSTKNRWLKYLVPFGGYILVALTHSQQDHTLGKVLSLSGAIIGNSIVQALGGFSSPSALEGPPWSYVILLIAATINLIAINALNIPLLFWALWRSGKDDRRVIRKQLSDELESVIAPEEYAGVEAERHFHLRSLPNFPKAIARMIVQRQNELAFRKQFVQRQGEKLKNSDNSPYDSAYRPLQAIREEIVQLRMSTKD